MKTKTQRNRQQPRTPATKGRPGFARMLVPLSVKADSIDTEARTFEGLAATWAEDLGQDVIHKGAFKASISEWKGSGEAMPLLNSHDHFNIFSALGQAIEMKETPEGLWTKWEVLPGAEGDAVMARLRPSKTTGRPIIGKMSIGFMATKFEFEQPEGSNLFFDRIRHIKEASLKEVSLVLFPMNPGASIDASTVKSFMQLARDTDPKSLDAGTRMELRRLNSRIGLLLKKQKSEDDEEDVDTEEEEQQTPPTPQAEVEDLGDDADNSDDSTDTADGTDDEDEADAAPEPTADPEPKAKDKPVPEAKKEEDKPTSYQYGEALKKRLATVSLKQKILNTQSEI